jgi:septum formation protein
MRRIVLASASPRRKELLTQIHLTFEVEPSKYAENVKTKLAPEALVRFLSREKAKAIAPKYPDSLIIAADTIGVIHGQVIGKPETPEAARRMLCLLSGKTHVVITGFTILDTGSGRMLTRTVKTEVTFRKLTLSEIDAYISSGEPFRENLQGEPLDKAGAYAIQGRGAVLVKELKGDYYNVMGLPLSALTAALKKFGVDVL